MDRPPPPGPSSSLPSVQHELPLLIAESADALFRLPSDAFRESAEYDINRIKEVLESTGGPSQAPDVEAGGREPIGSAAEAPRRGRRSVLNESFSELEALRSAAEREQQSLEGTWSWRSLLLARITPARIHWPIFMLLALGLGAGALAFWRWSPHTLWYGAQASLWLAYAAILLALLPLGSLVAALLVRLVCVLAPEPAVFYFVSPLEYPLCVCVWAAGAWVAWTQLVLNKAVDVPHLDLLVRRGCALTFIMGSVSCASLVIEKIILLRIQRDGCWARIRLVLYHEHVLRAFWAAYQRRTQVSGGYQSGGGSLPPRANRGGAGPSPTVGRSRSDLDVLLRLKPSYSTFARLQQMVMASPHVALAGDGQEVMGSERAAEAAARALFSWLDAQSGRRGRLTVADLARVLDGDTQLAHAAMALLSREADGDAEQAELSAADWNAGMRGVFVERQNLARTVADRDNVAGVVSNVMTVTSWVAILLVVLLMLQVPFATLLPFATFILGFSFVFGNSVKNCFESLLLVLAVRPFEVGDRIQIDDVAYIVSRIWMLTTEAYTTDGKLVLLPNWVLQNKYIVNCTRSQSYTVQLELTCPQSTPMAKLVQMQNGVHEFCARDNKTWATPNVFVHDQQASSQLVLKIWAPLRRTSWADPARYLPHRTALLLFVRQRATDLQITDFTLSSCRGVQVKSA